MAERAAVNRNVGGSTPPAPAIHALREVKVPRYLTDAFAKYRFVGLLHNGSAEDFDPSGVGPIPTDPSILLGISVVIARPVLTRYVEV